ncbi:MAG TPA: murein biosynthesis integral membrane protein MurJ [Streptosporangiaceae bacterium]
MSTPASPAGRSAADAAGPPPGAWDSAGLPGTGRPGTGEFGGGEFGVTVGGPAGGGPGGDRPPASGAGRADGPSVVRSSSVMALGTLASRGTGFLRTLVMAYALGVGTVANAYNNANTLPNTVYDLMLGGILTSIVVPLLVNAARRDADRGEAYDQRLFTLATVALFALTVVATLAGSLLVSLYAHAITGPERHLMVIFAYFFIPQIFFYGMSSLAGAVLNARGHFAAPMWTPLINNIVVIAVLLLFIVTGGIGTTASSISAGQVQLLGFGTTLGIIAQTAALVPFLRRVGFRWHPRFDFRRHEVTEILRMAGPLFGYIATTQVAFLVVANVANKASVHSAYDGPSTYTYAWQLFQMPYAIVGISVITALLPRMSAHASEKRYSLVKSDFSGGVRLSSVIVVPAALVLFVLGAPFAQALFGYGSTSAAQASYIGMVFGIFSLGLVPYMMFQLMLRVFYAMHDSRTPMFIGVAVMITNIVVCVLSLTSLPAGHVVEGVAAAFGLANLVGTVISWRILSRRLRGLDGHEIARSLIRMHLAAVPGVIFALATSFMIGVLLSPGPAFGIATLIVGGSGALLLYLLFARALGVTEISELTAGLRTRLHR